MEAYWVFSLRMDRPASESDGKKWNLELVGLLSVDWTVKMA